MLLIMLSLHRNHISFCIIIFLWNVVDAARVVEAGPKVISKDANGNEIWQYGSSTMPVIDFNLQRYSPKPLRPTLVYNCAFMASICKNMKQFAGSIPIAGSEWTFHLDHNTERKEARRKHACPTDWVHNEKKADGTPRCPETDQPDWFGYEHGNAAKHGPYRPKIHPGKDKEQKDTFNRLAKSWQRIRFNTDGTYEKSIEWQDYGAIMTCDEFPAATWIQGGAAGNGIKKATEYSFEPAASRSTTANKTLGAPYRSGCGNVNPLTPHQTQVKPLTTDQNWQGDAHNRLKDWTTTVFKQVKLTGSRDTKIYTFNLRTVHDISAPHASWIEANGIKRLCMGPGLSSGGKGDPSCIHYLRPGIDT